MVSIKSWLSSSHLVIRQLSLIVLVLLAPGIEHSTHQAVHKHNIHTPVTQVVLVLDMPVIWEEQIYAWLKPVPTILLVHVTQCLGSWEAD